MSPLPKSSEDLSPSLPITAHSSEQISADNQNDDDDNDWGEDPPIPEQILAFIRESNEEMGVKN